MRTHRAVVDMSMVFGSLGEEPSAGDALSPTERLVYLSLFHFADSTTGKCFPSASTLANCTGYNERTVRTALKKLEEAGFIQREHRPGAPGRSQLLRIENMEYHRFPDRQANRSEDPVSEDEQEARSGSNRILDPVKQDPRSDEHVPVTYTSEHEKDLPFSSGDEKADRVSAVCEHYEMLFEDLFPRGLVIGAKERKLVQDRLDDGFGVVQLMDAITNVRQNDWLCGLSNREGDPNVVVATLGYICKGPEVVTRWLNAEDKRADYSYTPEDILTAAWELTAESV